MDYVDLVGKQVVVLVTTTAGRQAVTGVLVDANGDNLTVEGHKPLTLHVIPTDCVQSIRETADWTLTATNAKTKLGGS